MAISMSLNLKLSRRIRLPSSKKSLPSVTRMTRTNVPGALPSDKVLLISTAPDTVPATAEPACCRYKPNLDERGGGGLIKIDEAKQIFANSTNRPVTAKSRSAERRLRPAGGGRSSPARRGHACEQSSPRLRYPWRSPRRSGLPQVDAQHAPRLASGRTTTARVRPVALRVLLPASARARRRRAQKRRAQTGVRV